MLNNENTLEFGKAPTAKSPVQFAAFQIADLDWSLDGEQFTIHAGEKDIPVHVDGLRYVLTYGLQQSLTDSYAAETVRDKAMKKFLARLTKIVEGTMPLDGKASGDPVRSKMREMAVAMLCNQEGKKESALRKALGKGWSRAVKALMDKHEDRLRKAAETIVETMRLTADLNVNVESDTAAEESETEDETPAEVEQPKVEGKKSSRRKAA